MSRPYYQEPVCEVCGCDDLRYKRGCLVCKGCGVVAQRGELDDKADYKTFYDNETRYDSSSSSKPPCARWAMNASMPKQKTSDPSFERIALWVLGIGEDQFARAQEIIENSKKNNAYMAASLCIACKEASMAQSNDVIIEAFETTNREFYNALDELEKKQDIHHIAVNASDVLVRMINKVDSIEENNKWCVVRTARKILERVGDKPRFKSQKPSKVNAAVIYISCCIQGLDGKVTRKKICEDLRVSLTTLKNHEGLLQELLG